MNYLNINKKGIKDIVIITDCKDVAFSEMRKQILLECSKLGNNYTEIAPLIPAEEFSIINGAFLTRLMAEHYRENVLFMVILNPSQKRPKRIFGKLQNNIYFEGANTGTLNWLFDDFGVESLYEVKEKKFYPFGGKYIHCPIVAQIASGMPFDRYGDKISKKEICDFTIPSGTVVHIDNFGLMKIKNELKKYKDKTKIKIFVNGKESITAIISRRMMNEGTGSWVLYPGSSMGLPELGKVRCKNGSKELGISIGDIITWEKI